MIAAAPFWRSIKESLGGETNGSAPFVAAGMRALSVNFVVGDKAIGRVEMTDVRSPYPFGLMLLAVGH